MAVKKTYIETPEKGRQLLIGDVHGCSETLRLLLQKLDLRTWDQIIFLGDYINKGPDSKGVLDLILELKNNNYTVFCLRGNNESYLLNTLKKNDNRVLRLMSRYGIENLFRFEGSNFKLRKKYRRFFKNTLHYIEADGFYAVHAGFDFKSETPFHNTYAMMWIRNFSTNKKWQGRRPVIHGHAITPVKAIRKAVIKQRLDIPLDNGCVLGQKNKDYGRLIGFDFTHNLLIEQRYAEREKPLVKP